MCTTISCSPILLTLHYQPWLLCMCMCACVFFMLVCVDEDGREGEEDRTGRDGQDERKMEYERPRENEDEYGCLGD